MSQSYSPTPTTTLRRLAGRGSYDRETVHAILDEALIAHIGTTINGRPVVQPTLHWRVGEEVFVHGSSKNGLFAALKGGAEACLTVSLIDGLVLARSAFHHSVNYRAVMAFGVFREVTDPAEKEAALAALMEKLEPGRGAQVRGPNAQELKGTGVYALTLSEVSAKLRNGPPSDDAADYDVPVWAGVVPLRLERGERIADPTPRPAR